MKRVRTLSLVGSCLGLSCTLGTFGCSPLVLMVRPPVNIDGYHGEGLIARVSNPLNPGFRLDYDTFIVNAPFARVYDVSGLPKPRHHSPYQVALVIDLTADEDANWPRVPTWLTTHGVGSVTVRVIDQTGEALVDADVDVSDLYWARIDDMPYGTPSLIRDACRDQWRFPSDAGNMSRSAATLEVRYVPGPAAVARSARFRLLAGGLE